MTDAPRRFTALINPISGGRRASVLWRPIERRLRAAGAIVTTVETAGRTDAATRAGQAADRGEQVVAVGGDGLVRDVAGALVPRGARLSVIPAGRGNDLIRTLAFPDDPQSLATMLLADRERVLDVLDVNGVIVPGNAYVGVDSAANRLLNSWRWVPGALLYRYVGVLAVLRWKPVQFVLQVDGKTHHLTGNNVVIANSGVYGHGLQIVPQASMDDGLLDVMVVGDIPRREIFAFTEEARGGRHVERPQVRMFRGRSVHLSVDRAIPLCADGDEIGQLPATVELRRAALRICAPVA